MAFSFAVPYDVGFIWQSPGIPHTQYAYYVDGNAERIPVQDRELINFFGETQGPAKIGSLDY